MQEQPPVTIRDPHADASAAEVLASGRDRGPGFVARLPRRAVVGTLALLLLVAGAAVGTDRYREHQAAERRAAAAFALADAVHTRVVLGDEGTYPAPQLELLAADGISVVPRTSLPETGRLVVPLMLEDVEGAMALLQDVQATGSGVTPELDLGQLAGRIPGSSTRFEVPVAFRCADVAAGRYPELTGLVVALVPESGRVHRVTVPAGMTRGQALEACGLPDPQAVPAVFVEEQHGRLVLEIEAIRRSRQGLRVDSVTVPGLSLEVSLGPGGDRVVPPETAVLFGVEVRVTDCAAARAGGGRVTVVLASGERRWTLVAADSPAADFRRPGSAYLRTVVARACP